MAQRLKAWLYRLLDHEQYLRLVSRLFFLAYRSRVLRPLSSFQCHYFVRRLIQPGDYVIDIGANLGYYSVLFAEWTGPEGKVFSVEPIPLYRKILRRNTESFSHVEIVPFALGARSETVEMGIPGSDPHRHGLTQVLSGEEDRSVEQTFEAEVRPPTVLFDALPRLDYIKCDVEGFEAEVVPALDPLIRKHRPTLQVEVAAENREEIFRLMDRLDYDAYFIRDDRLVRIEGPDEETRGDWIFRPRS